MRRHTAYSTQHAAETGHIRADGMTCESVSRGAWLPLLRESLPGLSAWAINVTERLQLVQPEAPVVANQRLASEMR